MVQTLKSHIFLAVLLTTPLAYAQQPLAWDDEIVVTAHRQPRPAGETTVSVEVVTAEDLAASAAATIDDALRRVPGFSLFRRTGSRTAHPTTQGVSLRGIGPSGTSRSRVLLDGLPINDPFGGWVYWSRLPRAGLERIEIVRGAASDLWGSAALGGVVHLVTAVPDHRFFVLDAEAGWRDERRLELAAGRAGERLTLLATGRYFTSDGYEVVRKDQRGAIDVAADSRHSTFYGKLRSELSPSTGLELRLNYFSEDRGNGTPLTRNDTRGGFFTVAADRAAPRSSWRGSLTAYDQSFASTFSSQASDRGSERPALDQLDVSSEAVRGDLQWTHDVSEKHRLTAGGELARTDASTQEDFFFVGTLDDGSFTRRRHAGGVEVLGGLFLQDEITVGPRWLVTLSGRVDLWEASSGFRREWSLSDGEVLRYDAFADRSRTTWSPRLGLRYQASPRVALHGAVYRGFRAPTINELYRPFRVRNDVTAANAELVTETIDGFELGLRFERRRLAGRLAAFANRLEDAVTNVTLGTGPGVVGPCGFVPAGGLCRQRRNLERIRAAGLEAELVYRPGTAWRLSASYLRTDSEVRRSLDAPDLEGKRLPQVPEEQAVLAVERTDASRLAGRLQVRSVSEQFEDDLNRRPLSSFVLVDLTLRHELRRGLELYLAAENLFDRTVVAGVTAEGLVTIGAPQLVHGGLRWRTK